MGGIFELKDIVWFFLGWLVPELIQKLFRFISDKNCKNKIKKVNANYIKTDENICPLSHGLPYYDKKNMILSEPLQDFHFRMPEEIHRAICEINPDFEHTKWNQECSYWGKSDDTEMINAILKITKNISPDDIRGLLEKKKIEVAEMFRRRATEAFFNGEMYGIKTMYDRREGNEEKVIFKTDNIKTDYYTHRVMAAVYQELLKNEHIVPPDGLRNINLYYPFLTAVGMDVVLVIENMNKVVVTKRSRQLINMTEDQWHLSMNEAISITDLHFEAIDLEGCVRRGLREELGIDLNQINQYRLHYSDVFFLKNPFEVGILGFVIIDELTEAMVRDAYNIAQDAPLESTGNDQTGLKFLPLSDAKIAKFCRENNVTAAMKYALKMLCIRKNML